MSVFDPVHETLNLELFDSNGVLYPEVRLQILERLAFMLKDAVEFVETVWLIGSSIGYQYNDTTDIDIQVSLPKEILKDINWDKFKLNNGALLNGTKHPINYYLAPHFASDIFPDSYDILNNKWLQAPEKPDEHQLYELEMQKPYLRMKAHAMRRQMNQLLGASNPKRIMHEATDVRDLYRGLDRDRKEAYIWGLGDKKKSLQNLEYKATENYSGFGESPANIERAMRGEWDWGWTKEEREMRKKLFESK